MDATISTKMKFHHWDWVMSLLSISFCSIDPSGLVRKTAMLMHSGVTFKMLLVYKCLCLFVETQENSICYLLVT